MTQDKQTGDGNVLDNLDNLQPLVFEQHSLPQCYIAPDGRIQRANRAICDMLGYAPQEFIGHRLEDFVVFDAPATPTDRTSRPLASGVEVEQHFRHRDGSILICLTTLTPIMSGEAHQLSVATLQDITQRKQHQGMLRTAAHELKNPLTNVTSAVDLLAEVLVNDDEGRSLLGMIHQSLDRSFELVNNLLRLARAEGEMPLIREDVDLDELLSDTVRVFELTARAKSIVLRYLPLDQPCTLHLDRHLIGQVMQNLVSNALKYTPESGTVEISSVITADEVIIRVLDNGLGIPANDLPNVFKPFYRVSAETHQTVEGTGLGLSITRAIVEQHDGQVWVESVLGEGSTFHVMLPLDT